MSEKDAFFFGNRSLNLYALPMENDRNNERVGARKTKQNWRETGGNERSRETEETERRRQRERKQIKPCSIREKTTQISQRVHRLAYLMKLIKT